MSHRQRHVPMLLCSAKQLARFWRDVDKSGECWLWTGWGNSAGYGQFSFRDEDGRRRYLAHRYSYWLATGDDPGDLMVLHSCDTPRCVRPEHLRRGTCLDNNHDMHKRGRAKSGSLPGSKHPLAKLTETDVIEIRRLHDGGMRRSDIAARFGVQPTNVSMITLRQTWRHVA